MNEYMTTNEDRVVILIDEYMDLIRAELTLDALLDALFTDAELEWDEKTLKFNQKAVCHVLCALRRNRYFAKIEVLKKEREEMIRGLNKDGE
jgi:hypothetical protein